MLKPERSSFVAQTVPKSAAHHGNVPSDAPTPREVRAQLQRVLDSPDFRSSARNRKFLAFVVERSLEGGRTGGYEVATKVFGRPASFNASSDPIVRIEAGKVRRDLETYHLKGGKDDPVHIVMPKGAYRAVFLRNGVSAAGNAGILRAALLGLSGQREVASASWRRLPSSCTAGPVDSRILDRIGAQALRDEKVRGLLLSGLLNAASCASSTTTERAADSLRVVS
ncbi:MAG: hypothetical protein FGM15_10635 [Chthoniobacterales bacterium]|nr:hypothetical protein [Chthoniobacterales bacterium]